MFIILFHERSVSVEPVPSPSKLFAIPMGIVASAMERRTAETGSTAQGLQRRPAIGTPRRGDWRAPPARRGTGRHRVETPAPAPPLGTGAGPGQGQEPRRPGCDAAFGIQSASLSSRPFGSTTTAGPPRRRSIAKISAPRCCRLFSVVTGTLRAPEKEVFKPGIVALSRYVDQAECMIARTHIQIRCHSSMVSCSGVIDR